ncbi:lactadherin-like [Montipora foliosa]|uniref:lactadherin-like n=1 Tax=Montipora foliosa TaxID=591990 RepID=UPI0035F157BF
MENGAIADGQISAASSFDSYHEPKRGRLHLQASNTQAGSWTSLVNDHDQWFQVDLGDQYTNVTCVATQGRHGLDQWVTRHKLQYSNDGTNFEYYKDIQGQNKVFAGNVDSHSVVHQELNPPIRARYIRFRPLTWNNFMSMRVELYGCFQECTAPALGMENGRIFDSQLTASSEAKPASLARLNGRFSWCPVVQPNHDFYIQIDLGSVHHVCGVATQGNPTGNKDYLTEYKLGWSRDNVFWDTSVEVLSGNSNWRDVTKHSIPVIYTRYIRLFPLKWHIWPCTRMEIYGESWPQVASAIFTGASKAVPSHVMTSGSAADVKECTKSCLITEHCKAFYFDRKMKKCDLSGSTLAVRRFDNKLSFYHYGRRASQFLFP